MVRARNGYGDAEIRSALRAVLLRRYGKKNDFALLEELGICRGRVRADMVVVNGALHGYEIKSDRDCLRRLAIQVEYYGKVLDKATLVVGERHLPRAMDLLPDWWGVLRVEAANSGPRFKTVRRARKNPGKDARSLVELLWYDDAIALLEERKLARGVRGKPRRFVWNRVCEYFSLGEITDAVQSKLKARTATPALP